MPVRQSQFPQRSLSRLHYLPHHRVRHHQIPIQFQLLQKRISTFLFSSFRRQGEGESFYKRARTSMEGELQDLELLENNDSRCNNTFGGVTGPRGRSTRDQRVKGGSSEGERTGKRRNVEAHLVELAQRLVERSSSDQVDSFPTRICPE